MTVAELIARLQEIQDDAGQVLMSVPQPGDDYYPVVKIDVWDNGDIVLQGPDQ